LGIQWQFYEKFDEGRLSFNNGSLTLKGVGNNLGESNPLTIVPRDKAYEIETELEVSGDAEAGIMLFVSNKEYVGLSLDASGQIKRKLEKFKRYNVTDEPAIGLNRIKFKIVNDCQDVRFYYKSDKGDWTLMQPSLEVSANGIIRPALFVNGNGKAKFNYFNYRELDK
jgi:beta-xylosidase